MSDPLRCAICGGPNDCGVAQGHAVCWCEIVRIPPEVYKAIPTTELNKTCVCQRCALRLATEAAPKGAS